MTSSMAWRAIICAGVVSFALRSIPFLAAEVGTRIPRKVEIFFELCGSAIVGSVMGESIFGPLFSSANVPLALSETGLRLGCTAIAMGLMVILQRQIIALLVSYGLFLGKSQSVVAPAASLRNAGRV